MRVRGLSSELRSLYFRLLACRGLCSALRACLALGFIGPFIGVESLFLFVGVHPHFLSIGTPVVIILITVRRCVVRSPSLLKSWRKLRNRLAIVLVHAIGKHVRPIGHGVGASLVLLFVKVIGAAVRSLLEWLLGVLLLIVKLSLGSLLLLLLRLLLCLLLVVMLLLLLLLLVREVVRLLGGL